MPVAPEAPGTEAPSPLIVDDAFALGRPASRLAPAGIYQAARAGWRPAFMAGWNTVHIAAAGVTALAVLVGAIWWFARTVGPDGTPLALPLRQNWSQSFRVNATMGATFETPVSNLESNTELRGILNLAAPSLDGDEAKVRGVLHFSSLTANGRPITRPSRARASMRLAADGTVVRGGTFDLPLPASPVMLAATGLVTHLPPHPVEPGDRWSDSREVQMGKDRLRMESHSEFVGYRVVDGVRAAVLRGTRTLTTVNDPKGREATISVEQTATFDPESGRILRMKATLSIRVDTRTLRRQGNLPLYVEEWQEIELSSLA